MIVSHATSQFWRLYEALPREVRQEARHAYRAFRVNPRHPSLHFKKLEGKASLYSVRVGLGYRALGVMHKSQILWFWIGSHADYDRLV